MTVASTSLPAGEQRFLSHFILLATILAATPLPASASPASDQSPVRLQSAQERLLVLIPKGPSPTEVGELACSDCDDCEAGLVFGAGADTIAFYDYERDNLKLISLSTAKVTALPGVGHRPWAGARSPDGDLFLLVDRFASGDPDGEKRFLIYRLAPGTTKWLVFHELDCDFLANRHGRRIVSDFLGLAFTPVGDLYLHDGSRVVPLRLSGDLIEQSRPVPIPLTELSDRAVKDFAAGRQTFLDTGDTVTTVRTSSQRDILGRDRLGRYYAYGVLPGWRFVIDRLDSKGMTLASIEIPKRKGRAILRGTSISIRSDGSLLLVDASPTGLALLGIPFHE